VIVASCIRTAIACALLSLAVPAALSAQGGRGGQPSAPAAAANPRRAAPFDLTGYWVSVVSEDWAWRMVTPRKGDYASLPLNEEGRRVADSWDPAKDEASGTQCRSYGVAHIMRVPGRVHVTWDNDTTLKIETDAGQQTRMLRFAGSPEPGAEADWQGQSIATWDIAGGRGGRGPAPAPRSGSLKVVTTRMKPGYLRKNGVPYSENAVVTEYFDRHEEQAGAWFTVTTIVEDPKYLLQPFITSTDFKKEPDGSKWRPVPCTAR
jgi:hypothetical protein